jgi:hypothetical protein
MTNNTTTKKTTEVYATPVKGVVVLREGHCGPEEYAEVRGTIEEIVRGWMSETKECGCCHPHFSGESLDGRPVEMGRAPTGALYITVG